MAAAIGARTVLGTQSSGVEAHTAGNARSVSRKASRSWYAGICWSALSPGCGWADTPASAAWGWEGPGAAGATAAAGCIGAPCWAGAREAGGAEGEARSARSACGSVRTASSPTRLPAALHRPRAGRCPAMVGCTCDRVQRRQRTARQDEHAYTCLRWSVVAWHMSHKAFASDLVACLPTMVPPQQQVTSQARLDCDGAVSAGAVAAVVLAAGGPGGPGWLASPMRRPRWP